MAKRLNKQEIKAIEIWKTHEIISHALRNRARDQVMADSGDILTEKLPGRQNDMLMTVRYLCEYAPDGIPLNALAKQMGIAPPTASVMADNLVNQGYLERYTAPEDRRAKRIRLTPRAEQIYFSGDKAVMRIILEMTDNLPEGFLDNWHALLKQIESRCIAAEK